MVHSCCSNTFVQRALLLLALSTTLGCEASIPEATFACSGDSDCPPSMVCRGGDGLCYLTAATDAGVDASDGATDSAPPCVPLANCGEARAECGEVPDGCDGLLDCGACEAPETCGAGGIPFICDCVPTTCSEAGATCGMVGDGCGRTLDCGGCPALNDCVGGVCQCPPATCESVGATCGAIPDGCGNIVTCGTCDVVGEFCGGGGTNVCGVDVCVPTTCGAAGADCGSIADGCDAVLTCPECTAPDVCGAIFENACACVLRSCDGASANCGAPADGCGGTLDCGACTDLDTCGGGGIDFQCGCTPQSCAELDAECGSIDSGCGPVFCGSCGSLATCASNSCECVEDAYEGNDEVADATEPAGARLSFPFSVVETSSGTHDGGDDDYFAVDVTESGSGPAAGVSIAANLRNVPAGSLYVLELSYVCPRGAPDVFICTVGTMSSSGDLAGPHCVSAPGAAPRVAATVQCSSLAMSGGESARLIVAVKPVDWAGQCEPYRLEMTGGLAVSGGV